MEFVLNTDREPHRHDFMTTQWTIVRGAVASSLDHRQRALEQLCGRYWMPLYAFLRRTGHSDHDSQDLVQGFFEQLLSKDFLKSVEQEKGRFRSFMLVAIKHYAAKERVRANAQKRGGATKTLSIDYASAEDWYRIEPIDDVTPEMLYERRWALSLLDNVMNQLRQRFLDQGKEELFDALKLHLVCDAEKLPYVQMAEKLTCSVESLKSTMHRLKGWYRDLLRAEIAQTVSPEEVADELQRLSNAISGNL